MTLPAPIDSSADLADIDTETLKAELSRQIGVTADHVRRLALIWSELERRGEDLSALRTGIASYLPAIAAGRLIPEAVVRLAGNRTALRAVAYLSPVEQRRLLDMGSIEVAMIEDGRRIVKSVPLHLMRPTEVSRAIDQVAGRTRPAAEQVIRGGKSARRANRRIIINLTESEHDRLLEEARRVNRSAAAMVVQALRNEKLI